MSTSTVDTITTGTTPAPVEPDLASLFYDTADQTDLGTVVVDQRPSTDSETGPTVTPEASTVSTETATTEESPVGTETITKPEEQKGHVAAARRLGQEVADLKKQFQATIEENRVLKAKLDGTYEEPAQPTSEEVMARAEFKGRETASRVVAEDAFGSEIVKTSIYDEDSPYKALVKEQPWLHARVIRHPQPAVEAMRVLREQEFVKTYGADPTKWVQKIEAALTPRLLKDLQRQAVTPVTGKPAPSVTTARGSGGSPRDRSADEMFYGKES